MIKFRHDFAAHIWTMPLGVRLPLHSERKCQISTLRSLSCLLLLFKKLVQGSHLFDVYHSNQGDRAGEGVSCNLTQYRVDASKQIGVLSVRTSHPKVFYHYHQKITVHLSLVYSLPWQTSIGCAHKGRGGDFIIRPPRHLLLYDNDPFHLHVVFHK